MLLASFSHQGLMDLQQFVGRHLVLDCSGGCATQISVSNSITELLPEQMSSLQQQGKLVKLSEIVQWKQADELRVLDKNDATTKEFFEDRLNVVCDAANNNEILHIARG